MNGFHSEMNEQIVTLMPNGQNNVNYESNVNQNYDIGFSEPRSHTFNN